MVKEQNSSETSSDSEFGFHFGSTDQHKQIFTSNANTYQHLLDLIPTHLNPIQNWNQASIPSSDNVLSWFRNDDHIAFIPTSSSNKKPLSYKLLHQQIQAFPNYHTNNKDNESNDTYVVGVLLPPCYMAELAVTFVTLLAQHNDHGICLAPIDSSMPQPKIVAALQQLQCSALVTTSPLYDKLLQNDQNNNNNILDQLKDIRIVKTSDTDPHTGIMDWSILKQEGTLTPADFADLPHRPALLLRTSGTTSIPKVVPITASSLLYNATCLATSLDLQPDDVGCNVMPLFHIGGIACGLLTVLVSGSSVVMVPGPFESNTFVDALTDDTNVDLQPTWYYGVPSMHKAIGLTAKSRIPSGSTSLPNHRLKFIRSGAAHLPHATALELAEVFRTKVMPTYSMSESMPVCSCHEAPVSMLDGAWNKEKPRGSDIPDDTVGVPIGASMAILDADDEVLPYGEIGEVCLKGPGVISGYVGVSLEKSHTSEGWFRTGDMGKMNRSGFLVLSGRSKEVIKRGGDQVWPNEIDSLVASVPGVRTSVTFGVPNELWGEEVQIAIVLGEDSKHLSPEDISETIRSQVEEEIGTAARPSKVLILDSPDQLLKGSTGKYMRSKMAEHLGARASDTGALKALQGMANANTRSSQPDLIKPSDALNGLRFLTACFVVQIHVGFMPNNGWMRVQNFTFNMTIFFMLAAFQLTASTRSEVLSSAGQFIGTKIGSMQAFFIVAHAIAIGSYLLFQCGEGGFTETFLGYSCQEDFGFYFPMAIINMFTGLLTGLGFVDPTNAVAWFQTAFYFFVMLFPFLDWHLRSKPKWYKSIVLLITISVASTTFLYNERFPMLPFRFVSWMPALVASMIAAYFFTTPSVTQEEGPEDTTKEKVGKDGKSSEANTSAPAANVPLWHRPGFWGVVTDVLSLTFLIFEIIVILAPDCLIMPYDKFQLARPGEEPIYAFPFGETFYAYTCGITHDEYEQYIFNDPRDLYFGRWFVDFSAMVGNGRLGSPLVLLWLYGMAHGRGLTARFFLLKPFQVLSPYAYPVYLLHSPIARFYWVATRGHVAEWWWPFAPGYPFPVEWWEFFIILVICLVVSVLLDWLIVRHLVPYTIQIYVRFFSFLQRCFCRCRKFNNGSDGEEEDDSVSGQVAKMVKGLTGNDNVHPDTILRDLGLDSLGATALLGTLRANIPAARGMTMAELARCETVGDLVEQLGGVVETNDSTVDV